MLFVIVLLVIFLLILSLILGLSVGVSFLLAWLFPNIPFATGVVIGAISSSFSIYFLVRLVVFIMKREPADDLDGEFSEDLEEEGTEYIILPRIIPPSKRKKRQKRK